MGKEQVSRLLEGCPYRLWNCKLEVGRSVVERLLLQFLSFQL